MAKKPRTFYQELFDRHEAFRPIEEAQAEVLRKQLLSVKREAQKVIRDNMRAYVKDGKYIDSSAAINQAKATVSEVGDLLKRGFGQTQERLLSMKESAFQMGVSDFELASKRLPGDIATTLSGSFAQVYPEAAYAAAEHPVLGIHPGNALKMTVADARLKTRDILTKAVLNGEPVRDTADKLGAALDLDRAAAERIVRTNLNAAYNDAQKAVIQANSDIFAGYRWEATLDDRTSDICLMLHGQQWGLEEIPPGPPAHWNCRSILVPVFRDASVQSLMDEDITRVRNYTLNADGSTTQKDGFIRGGTTATDWARKQPSVTVRELTGSRLKAQLFSEGKIGFNDIIGPDFKRRTDREILRRAAALNPRDHSLKTLAFEKGVKVPSKNRILAEDRALQRKQWWDPPSEELHGDFSDAAPSPRLTDPKKIARAEKQLEEVKFQIEKVEEKIHLASGEDAVAYKAQRAKLMKKKRVLQRKLPTGGPIVETPTVKWQPEMTEARAAQWGENSKIKTRLYHGTNKADDIKSNGFTTNIDEVNDHPGISFTSDRTYAKTYGDELLDVQVDVRNPLEVDADFWRGTSTKESHLKIYRETQEALGLDDKAFKKWLREADPGDLSRAIEAVGHDAWYTRGATGEIGELRLFSKTKATVVKPSVTPPAPKPKPTALEVSAKKQVQSYTQTATQIDTLDDDIRSTLAALEKDPENARLKGQLQGFKETRAKLAKRARSYKRAIPETLRSDLPEIKNAPTTPGSVKPVKLKPGPKPTPAAEAPAPVTEVSQASLPTKARELVEEYEKLTAEFNANGERYRAIGREVGRALKKKTNIQRGITSGNLDDVMAQIRTLRNERDVLRVRAIEIGPKLRSIKSELRDALHDTRIQQVGKLQKPTKFIKDYQQAAVQAQQEMDALFLGPKYVEMNTYDDVLKTLAQLNGQGPGTELSSNRAAILKNFSLRAKTSGVSSGHLRSLERSMEEFLRACDDSILVDRDLRDITWKWERTSLAHAQKEINEIVLAFDGSSGSTSTTVHEFAHHLEYRNDGHARRIRDWWNDRTRYEKLTQRGHSRAYKDKFYEHYVGREHQGGNAHGRTEATSMGVQTLTNHYDFTSVNKKDPDHLYLIWAFLRGY